MNLKWRLSSPFGGTLNFKKKTLFISSGSNTLGTFFLT